MTQMTLRGEGESEGFSIPATGFDIMADDGRALYSFRMSASGVLEVSVGGGGVAKHGGVMLDSQLIVLPRSSNVVHIGRAPWEG